MSVNAFLTTTVGSESGFNWRPGIGDPTIAGWLTVLLYIIATLWFWVVAAQLRLKAPMYRREWLVWRALFCLFLCLGLNKQLDLQTALTEVGRVLAHSEGWYDQRRPVQILFIFGVAGVALIGVVALFYWAAFAPISVWLALSGALGVAAYVVIRAASFHHIDRFIGGRILGMRWNWILEMGSICVAWLGAQLRARELSKLPLAPASRDVQPKAPQQVRAQQMPSQPVAAQQVRVQQVRVQQVRVQQVRPQQTIPPKKK